METRELYFTGLHSSKQLPPTPTGKELEEVVGEIFEQPHTDCFPSDLAPTDTGENGR